MCDFSGKLIAWLDNELPEAEAVNVAWHIRQCAECRRAADAYREISGAFLACYTASIPVRRGRSVRWIGAAFAAAAAVLIAAFLAYPRPQKLRPQNPRPQKLLAAPSPVNPPAMAFEKTPPRAVAVRLGHSRAAQPAPARWIAVQPDIEIALPADALFPPGAVPPGFSYIADVRLQP